MYWGYNQDMLKVLKKEMAIIENCETRSFVKWNAGKYYKSIPT